MIEQNHTGMHCPEGSYTVLRLGDILELLCEKEPTLTGSVSSVASVIDTCSASVVK